MPSPGPYQLDGLHGFGRVEVRALGGNDDEIRTAHRVARHHRRRALQIDDDERGFQRGRFNGVDDGVFGRRIDDQ